MREGDYADLVPERTAEDCHREYMAKHIGTKETLAEVVLAVLGQENSQIHGGDLFNLLTKNDMEPYVDHEMLYLAYEENLPQTLQEQLQGFLDRLEGVRGKIEESIKLAKAIREKDYRWDFDISNISELTDYLSERKEEGYSDPLLELLLEIETKLQDVPKPYL